MNAVLRPWANAGLALATVGVIAAAPIAPPPALEAPRFHSTAAVELTAIPEILTLPVVRQIIANSIDDIVVWAAGWADAGVGLVESLALIPSTLATAIQQLLAGDLTGALTTMVDATVASIVAVGGPLLASNIERRQRDLAVQTALQLAIPQSIIAVTVGAGAAVNTVTNAFIVAGQGVTEALLPPDLGALVDALVDGTVTVLTSFATAGGQIVDGIVTAQQTIATALATPAPLPPAAVDTPPEPAPETVPVPSDEDTTDGETPDGDTPDDTPETPELGGPVAGDGDDTPVEVPVGGGDSDPAVDDAADESDVVAESESELEPESALEPESNVISDDAAEMSATEPDSDEPAATADDDTEKAGESESTASESTESKSKSESNASQDSAGADDSGAASESSGE